MSASSTHAAPVPRARTLLPDRFCNLERLLHAMQVRNIDGLVATSMLNVFYLTGFNSIAHKSDEPRPYAVILSRDAPEHPVFVLADQTLDAVLGLSILHLLDNKEEVIAKVHRTLKPGGIFVTSTACIGDTMMRFLKFIVP